MIGDMANLEHVRHAEAETSAAAQSRHEPPGRYAGARMSLVMETTGHRKRLETREEEHSGNE